MTLASTGSLESVAPIIILVEAPICMQMDVGDDAGTLGCDHYNRADEALYARFVHHWSVVHDGGAQVLFHESVNSVPVLEGTLTLGYLAAEMDVPFVTCVPTAGAPIGNCRQDNLNLAEAFPVADGFATEVADELQVVTRPTTSSGLEDSEHADEVCPVVRLVQRWLGRDGE